LWNALQVYRADIKHKKIKAVETSHIISTLDNEEESFRVFSQKSLERSFVVLKNLTSEAADVLREVLMNQRVARGLLLISTDLWNITSQVFPARFHRIYIRTSSHWRKPPLGNFR
jgi:hypothetical protein